MTLPVGAHADLTISNVTILGQTADEQWVQVQLPAAGEDPANDERPPSYWLPLDRVTVSLITPANWPPVEGDLWEVTAGEPPTTLQAWVVAGGADLYFVTGQNILDLAQGKQTKVLTTDEALSKFGSSLSRIFTPSEP